MKKIKPHPSLPKLNDSSSFRDELLNWYDHNHRILPWRSEPTLYKTVLSEFMLQQTRVSTVLPYFDNWIKKFPDFDELANASEEQVIKAWEGLGYYSRARNIHKLAKIATTWETPPDTIKEWKKLPGVGPYIAAAVTSISLGKAEAVCDGNLVRVLSRLFGIDEEYKDGATAQKKLQPLAQSIIDQDRPGDYNQGMMELGATVCHRHSPLCMSCPVLKFCRSGKTGDAEDFPRIQKKKKKKKNIQRYWVESTKGLLLCMGTNSKNKLMGIFELPDHLPTSVNIAFDRHQLLATKKRTIGNVDYNEKIFRISNFNETNLNLGENYRWISRQKLENVTLSGPHRKWITELWKVPK